MAHHRRGCKDCRIARAVMAGRSTGWMMNEESARRHLENCLLNRDKRERRLRIFRRQH